MKKWSKIKCCKFIDSVEKNYSCFVELKQYRDMMNTFKIHDMQYDEKNDYIDVTLIDLDQQLLKFALPIFQSEIQMKNIYDYELIDSCEYKILFASDNDKFANKISTVAGTYKTQDDANRTTTTKNLEIENIVNIPGGYLGLSLIKRFKDDKNFYIAPVTYWYMLQGVGLGKKFKLKSNDKYLLTHYTKILDEGVNNNGNNSNPQTSKKQWKFSWLKINEDQLNQDNKSRCLQLMNNIVNHLNYFKYHQELIPAKVQAIQDSFTSLQALTQNQLTDSLIFEFLTASKANQNIIFEKDNKDNENKTQN